MNCSIIDCDSSVIDSAVTVAEQIGKLSQLKNAFTKFSFNHTFLANQYHAGCVYFLRSRG